MKSLITIISFLLVAISATASNGVTDPDQDSDTLNQKIDNRKHGYWMIYAHMRNEPNFKPDDVIEEGRFKMSRKIGQWKKYFPGGNLKSEIVYKNGKAIGEFTTYYNNDENTIEEAGTWGGRIYKDKFIRRHANGEIAQEKFFNESGKPEGRQVYYHENGQIELEFEMKNGIETGTATRYWPNGDIKEIINFDEGGNGTSQGEVTRVNPPVILDSQKEDDKEGPGLALQGEENAAQKKGGIVDGYHKTYNENKDILMDGEFKKGKLWKGKLYIYDEFGLLEKIEIYKKGKYIGNGVIE